MQFSKTSESPRRGLDRESKRPRHRRSREPNQGHRNLDRDQIEYNTNSRPSYICIKTRSRPNTKQIEATNYVAKKNEHKRPCLTRRRLPQSTSSRRRSRSCCLPCHSGLGKMNSRDGEDKQQECVAAVASNDACTAHRRHRLCWTPLSSLIQGLCRTEVQRRRGAGSSRCLGVRPGHEAVSSQPPPEENLPPLRALFFFKIERDRCSWKWNERPSARLVGYRMGVGWN
jgi:hypothetical protein